MAEQIEKFLARPQRSIHGRKILNERAVQMSLDVGKEKTQFFEKIAITNGGIIALIVGFVGLRAGRLQPPWLLRSALATFVLSLVGATYRNWRFPFYLYANYARQQFDAKLKVTYAERACFSSGPIAPINEDGAAINLDDSNKRLAEEEKFFKAQIDQCQRIENRSFKTVAIFAIDAPAVVAR